MTNLSQRRTKLKFQTASAVWERGEYRPVVIEAHAAYCEVRVKGMRKSYPITYAAIFHAAVKMAVREEQNEKKAKRKAGGR